MKKTIKKVANVVLGCITAAAFLCFMTDAEPGQFEAAEKFQNIALAVTLVAGFGFYKTLDKDQLKKQSTDANDII